MPGSAGSCDVPVAPAIAYGNIYAGCDGIGAYTLLGGDQTWVSSLTESLSRATVADGVVYVRLGETLAVFDAYDGALLWSGNADCIQAPVVVNGTVYVGRTSVDALTPQGVVPTSVPRPAVEELHPDMALAPQRTPERLR